MTEVKWRRRVLTPEEIQHMILDYNQNMPIKEITAKYGMSKATIYNILKREVGNEQ